MILIIGQKQQTTDAIMTINTINRTLRFVFIFLAVFLFGYAGQAQTLGSVYTQDSSEELYIEGGENLKNALEKLEQHYNVGLLYRSDIVEGVAVQQSANLSLNVEEALSFLLKGTDLRFKALNPKTYGIYKNAVKVPQATKSIILQQDIVGTVVDAETGEPLPGVNVIVEGSEEATGATIGTITNAEGHFEIQVPENLNTLVFTYVGYQSQEISIDDRSEIDVELMSEAIVGEELVVIGYGTAQQRNITGAISQIESEEIGNRTVNNTTQALQGLASNLNISVTDRAGEADAPMNMNVRGIGSLSTSDPYILIDGVRATQSELSNLNPRDIENISVLKDAAASAIYGAQAAYGVVLISTKEGVRQQDLNIQYSNDFRFHQLTYVPETVNSLEFAEWANLASDNLGGGRYFSDEQIEKIRQVIEEDPEYQTGPLPNNPNQWAGIGSGRGIDWYNGYANTDLFDVMFKDFKPSMKHDLSVSGGSDNLAYYLSGGWLKDSGQLNYGEENYSQYNFNSSITADITSWLTLTNKTRLSRVHNVFPANPGGSNRNRLYHDIMRFAPTVPVKTPPVKDENGNTIVSEQLVGVPAFAENHGFEQYNTNNLVTTLKGELDLLPNLVIHGDFSFKKETYAETFNFKRWTLLGPDSEPSIVFQENNNQIAKEVNETDYTSFNVYAEYTNTFLGSHNVDIMAGYQQEENSFSGLNVSRREVINHDLNSTNVAVGEVIGPNNPMESWATMGIFGRASYNFQERYLFEFNGRYDGSSRFAPGDRFGFFPSVSVGYNVHEENFWQNLRGYINVFKVRGSWGSLGNQNVSSYLYLPGLPVQDRLPWVIGGERPVYTGIPDIVSPDITWETSTVKNIGIDVALFDRRLSAKFDVYERLTENMFGPIAALPAVLGTEPPETNSASLKTNGWELNLEWSDQVSNDFGYNVRFLISDNQSTITEYNNPEKVLSDWYEGQKIGEIWGFEADKLFQSQEEVDEYLAETDMTFLGTNWQPGNVKYKDLNNDGEVDIGENTVDSPGDRRIIGNDHPRYRFSLQVGMSWRNFDFSMMWEGVGKRDIWLGQYATLFWGWNRRAHSRLTEATKDYWSEENPDAYLPIPLDGAGRAGYGKDRQVSTRYLQNGAYAKLRNLEIGYTLPSGLLNQFGIENMRVYLKGDNLFTITDMWPNIDPELAANRGGTLRVYPLSRVFGAGLSISL